MASLGMLAALVGRSTRRRAEGQKVRWNSPGYGTGLATVAMARPAIIPAGSWPRRMGVELAAAYCGESTVDAFMKRVGREYPLPRICDGRRRLWLRDDLDAAILPAELARVTDVAEDL